MSGNRYLLAIESSTAWGSVAVGDVDGVLAEASVGARPGGRSGSGKGRGGHSEALLPAVDHVLRTAGLIPSDLDAVVVGSGPGSFTGVRIAGATAKGIVHALGVPLLAYSSLLAAAAPWARDGATVCAMFDARGRDVFAACYRFDERIDAVVPPAAMTLDEAVGRCREWQARIVTGDALGRHGGEIESETGAIAAPLSFAAPRAAALLWLAARYPVEGAVPDPAGWEPDYLRASGAERIAERRAGAAGGTSP